jgi:NAD(P) transhydrogenase
VAAAAPTQTATKAAADAKKVAKVLTSSDYFQKYARDSLVYSAGLGGLIGLGIISPNTAFANMVTTLALSGLVGYHTGSLKFVSLPTVAILSKYYLNFFTI